MAESVDGWWRGGRDLASAARWAKTLAWVSLLWMCAEGALGVWHGLAVGSIALTGSAFGSAVEGVASVIVVWRFSGPRASSETAEQRARKAVAVSFWLLAPYVAAEAMRDLTSYHHAATTVIGMAVAASSFLLMPALGRAKQRLGDRLDFGVTLARAYRSTCAPPRPVPC